jgi:hypothetical protein
VAVVVVFALDSTIVVAWLAVVETYVKLNVVPEITVVVTPNGTIGVGADEELLVMIDVDEVLL